jgi:hypothetical protein
MGVQCYNICKVFIICLTYNDIQDYIHFLNCVLKLLYLRSSCPSSLTKIKDVNYKGQFDLNASGQMVDSGDLGLNASGQMVDSGDQGLNASSQMVDSGDLGLNASGQMVEHLKRDSRGLGLKLPFPFLLCHVQQVKM